MEKRAEEAHGRQLHNGNQRLLSGVTECAKCGSPMFGGGGTKANREYLTYYVCSKRMSEHDCDQDYMRADHLEQAIVMDLKQLFQDEAFLKQVWAKTNEKLVADKPDLDKELTTLAKEIADVNRKRDRYFEAFEADQLDAKICNDKTKPLYEQLEQLKVRNEELEARRTSDLPELDITEFRALLDRFEEAYAAATRTKKSTFSSLL